MIPGLPPHATGGPVAIISAMITPAILIMATGNFIASTLMLHGRVVDRARLLMERKAEYKKSGDTDTVAFISEVMHVIRLRLALTQYALAALYVATGCFVATSLAIALEEVLHAPDWLASGLTVAGAVTLLVGSLFTLVDTFLSTRITRRELDRELL